MRLIHIGYHKTGTNWIKDEVFAREEFGLTLPFTRKQEISAELVFPNALDFDAERARARFGPALEEAEARGLVPVVSAERLCGSPHSGGYDSKEIADRLAATFGEAKVLIVIREQRAMVLSTYLQYVRAGGTASLRDYLEPPDRGRARLPMFSFAHFEYDRLAGYYRRLFGDGNVHVLPYELFRSDPPEFVRSVLRFIGVPEPRDEVLAALPYGARRNVSFSGASLRLRRAFNFLFVRDRVNVTPIFPVERAGRRWGPRLERIDARLPRAIRGPFDRRLQARTAEIVGDRYRESNARTQLLAAADLAAFGYDV